MPQFFLNQYLPEEYISCLSIDEKEYLNYVFDRYSGWPKLQEIWELMDEAWCFFKCDDYLNNENITSFYNSPVWLLNGLFIDQHEQSLNNRHAFANWVIKQSPKRVADFGGGFGGLARLIGENLPSCKIEVVEPHPHPLAITLARNTNNIRYVNHLDGQYDLIISTDVYEHVFEPLELCAFTAMHLCIGGKYLMANCFQPVIKCHLPQLYHHHYSWDFSMKAMGLQPVEDVLYGKSYIKNSDIKLESAKIVERFSINLYKLIRFLPKGRYIAGKLIMSLFFSR